MKTLKSLIITILSFSSIYLHAQISDKITINLNDIQTYKIENGYDKIRWKSDYTTQETGNPELPIYRVTYVLPIDTKITEVKFTRKEKKILKENLLIVPVQQPILTNNIQPIGFTQPNIHVYGSEDSYPNKICEIEADEIFMGYHIVTLLIYPFEYKPKSRNLFYYPELNFTINYVFESDPNEIKPLTQTILRSERCKSFIRSIVANKDDVDRFGSNVKTICDGKVRQTAKKISSQQRVKSLSVMDEMPPNYIIITCDSLKSTFTTLAEWKTKKGIYTIIKTVEEIANEYSGIDLPEKIRKYIIESYTRWGSGLYILLGGDNNIIPARMVVGIDNILQAADMYYSSYNGNWNSDGDNLFNAPNYISQINIGVLLGRLPVKNTTEASHLINKLVHYENAANMVDTNYLTNYLYSDAYMTPNGATSSTPLKIFDLDSIKSYVSRYVPSSYFHNKYICDNAFCNGDTTHYTKKPCPGGDIELNRENFLSCLNSGANLGVGKFHFIYHMDHSGAQSMGTSSIDKSQGITNTDVDGLTNGGATQILMSGSCHPANFVENCIAEHYLNKQAGGGVAFIGNTDSGYTNEHDQLGQFLKGLFNKSLFSIGETYLYVVKQSNSSRNSKPWRLHLLGDPEMQVWTNVPQTLSVRDTSAILIGEQNIDITINNLPAGQSALICFHKGSEIYLTDTINSTLTHNFTVKPETTGEIDLTITTHNFKPYEKVISVNQTSAPNLFVKTVDFLDSISPSIGNGNGKNDAGETIQLKASIKNSGINTANNLTATLGINSSYINILNNQATISSLASGDTTNIYFLYSIDKNTKEILANDKQSIRFNITLQDTNNEIWKDSFNIDIYDNIIRQGNKPIVYLSNGHSTIQSGDTVRFNIDLKNIGKAPTKGLKAKITAVSATFVNSFDTIWHNYPIINWKEVKQADTPFEFIAGSNILKNLKFNLVVENEYGKQWTDTFSLYKPPVPEGLDEFSADSTEIDLKWNYSTSYSGFNVYRCNVDSATSNPVGNYVKINTDSVTFTYYLDKNLGKLTKYLYKVSAISKSGNEGELSSPFLGWTSFPVRKFPLDFKAIRGGITAVDINNDGYKEIFGATKGGYIVGLDNTGKELYNIDGNVTTQGAFAQLQSEVWGTPAIGDMLNNGELKIVDASYFGTPNNNLYCFSINTNIAPTLSWKKVIPNSGNYLGSVLSNIDNSQDGSLETVTLCVNGQIAIFAANGDSLTTIGTSNGFYAGAIAVADLDGDGDKEIIMSKGSSVYIWEHDGNPYKGCVNGAFYTNTSGTTFNPQVVVCDIDNDNKKEILATTTTKIFAIRTDNAINTLVDNWNQPNIITNGSMSVGDLNHDGNIEIVTLGINKVTVLDNHGDTIRSLSIPYLTPAGNPILADVDGNSNNEIIFGSTAGTSLNIYGYNMDLSKVLGFPLKTHTGAYCVPNVTDINNDGKNDLVLGVDNWMYIWKTNGNANNSEWGSIFHDQYNTAEYQKTCDITKITANEIWNSNHSFCGDLIIESGTLTINNNSTLTMGNSTTITIQSGASFVIDSGIVLNANIRALAGSNVTIKNNGSIMLRSNAEFCTETGTIIDIQYGSIDK